MIILQVDNVTPDELGFALTFLALVMVCVAVDKIISEFKKASREIKAAQWDLQHPADELPDDDQAWDRFVAAHACVPCGGTGKAAEFATTKRGTTKQIGHGGVCKACGGTGVAA